LPLRNKKEGYTVLDRNSYHVTDRGNEIILADMESVTSRKFRRRRRLEFARRKGNDPFRIFRFVIQDEQMVLIIIALGSLAPSALKDAKDNLN